MNSKTKYMAGAAVAVALLFTSCQGDGYDSNTKTGTAIGAGVGALAGAIIGNQSGRPLEGAGIGALAGGAGGALIGSAEDDRMRRSRDRYYSNPNYGPPPRRGYYRQPSSGYYPEPSNYYYR